MLNRTNLACIAAILMLSACGGGSSGTGDNESGVGSDSASGLAGKLILDPRLSNPLLVMDLATRQMDQIPGTDWPNQSRFDRRVVGFKPNPSAYGRYADTLIPLVVDSCGSVNPETGLRDVVDCLDVQHINGDYDQGLTFDSDIYQPSLSPDARLIALYQKRGASVSSPDSLRVLRRDGSFVSGYNFTGSLAHQDGFAWIDNRTIYFAAGRQIGVLDIESAAPPGAFSFPASYGDGNVSQINASRDGQQVFFAIGPTLVVMNRDGTRLREIVRATGNRSIRRPSWSPDGTRLIFFFGYVNDTGVPDADWPVGVPRWRLVSMAVDRNEPLLLDDDLTGLPDDVRVILRIDGGSATTGWTKDYGITWKPD